MKVFTHSLTDQELSWSKDAALLRIEESAKQGLNHATTYERTMDQRLHEEMVGTTAEGCWELLCGRQWRNPINEFHQIPDDGIHEIRATSHPSGGLIIRNNDANDRKYVFAIVNFELRNITFYGWAYGWEVKKPENSYNPYGRRAAWRMDRAKLNQITDVERCAYVK